ncbi:Hypothetical_protein [Hexamita inflata]|uniref:Hypothetical_protein n=1 Tax=Hexamita inflata TaxID=28002 RepID=A0AA86THH2_9EUKA|nr:Hypothetical protein HINF_LOCUS4996 [Hexamita inflata]CAI9924942.1 Hypothetical protein HINF_LOCUS12587 [Hexamita inflata]
MCPTDSSLIGNICLCPQNSILVGNACICNQISGQQMIAKSCQCPSGQSIINNSCQTNYVINMSDLGLECSQFIFTTSFSISTVTNSITSSTNFSSGYVFGTATVISNALIDVANNVYSTMQPLFQSQTTFNSIQLQFETQTMTSGNIFSNIVISITQVNILSKINSQIAVSSGQLNIMSQQSNNANILNLLINLSFSLQNGKITLINTIQNSINVTNYQVSGIYQSYFCVSLVSLISSSTVITVNNLNFAPTVFNVGNQSSYLFSQVQNCSVLLNSIAIILGSNQVFQELVSANYSDYQFGGLVTSISKTRLQVNNVISSSYQNYGVKDTKYSGFLVGNSTDTASNVTIQNLCLQLSVKSTGQFYYFGIVGFNQGNTSFSQAQVSFSCAVAFYNGFGIIGVQFDSSKFSEITDVEVVLVSNGAYGYVGALYGYCQANVKKMSNILVNRSSITAEYYTGGLIGYVIFTTALVQNATVQFSNLSSSGQASGGLIGTANGVTLQLFDITINTVRIVSASNSGIVLGANNGVNTFVITNSKSTGVNYVNNVVSANCVSFTNTWSVRQC